MNELSAVPLAAIYLPLRSVFRQRINRVIALGRTRQPLYAQG